jgi:hypothetical protein
LWTRHQGPEESVDKYRSFCKNWPWPPWFKLTPT